MPEKFFTPPAPWPHEPDERTAFEKIRSSLLNKFLFSTVALNACTPQAKIDRPEIIAPAVKPAPSIRFETKPSDQLVDPEIFAFHKNGMYTPKELHDRTIHLAHDVTVLEDAGIFFYKVCPEDTISSIREKLAQFSEFSYLKNQTGHLQTFSIPAHDLHLAQWIPIPLERTTRIIEKSDFIKQTIIGIDEILNEPLYGPTVQHILDKTGMDKDQLVAALLVIAKQESGGAPLGQFEFHRWEGHDGHHEFSFSIFHILMSGIGLKVRRELGMTEGQTYNVANATKLFLAYIVQKSNRSTIDPADFFPFTPAKLERFASFYNGGAWKTGNPDYVNNVWRHYQNAIENQP